jgi:predicted ATPase
MPGRVAVLTLLALGFASCATNKETTLITDPDAKKETAIPWNEQQKWEREGEAAALNQQRR